MSKDEENLSVCFSFYVQYVENTVEKRSHRQLDNIRSKTEETHSNFCSKCVKRCEQSLVLL